MKLPGRARRRPPRARLRDAEGPRGTHPPSGRPCDPGPQRGSCTRADSVPPSVSRCPASTTTHVDEDQREIGVGCPWIRRRDINGSFCNFPGSLCNCLRFSDTRESVCVRRCEAGEKAISCINSRRGEEERKRIKTTINQEEVEDEDERVKNEGEEQTDGTRGFVRAFCLA